MRIFYPATTIERFIVSESSISWKVELKNYKPPYYTSKTVLAHPSWADPEDTSEIKFNSVDGKINRVSYMGNYLVKDGYPLNPSGRTGLCGRGRLGKWGPNHAVDIIISRYNVDAILEFLIIERMDNGRFALPGGMIDDGENILEATLRETQEEVIDNYSDDGLPTYEWVKEKLKTSIIVFQASCNDSRSTDNAWIETTASGIHDHENETWNLSFRAGSDAASLRWCSVKDINMVQYGHRKIIQAYCKKMNFRENIL